MNDAFEKAWSFCWEKLFCEKTNLFYDWIADGAELTALLPTPEEIQAQVPNPCGWGTGMEDSVLNAGNMMRASLARYNLSHDTKFADLARKIYTGLKTCIMASESRGFLARSVSPVDGKSHYSNSSRDQYTHFVMACLRYYQSDIATEQEKIEIRHFLSEIAMRGERNVIPENNYDLLREDGHRSLVCNMAGKIDHHESMRLPMFYISAAAVTGNEHFMDCYKESVKWALPFNEQISYQRDWLAYALMQMQLSLRICWELDTNEEHRCKMLTIMKNTADYAAQTYPPRCVKQVENGLLKHSVYHANWRKCLCRYMSERVVDGKAYFVPSYDETFLAQFLTVRDVGEAVIIQELCPGYEIAPEQLQSLHKVADAVDYDTFGNYGPVLLLDAWYSTLAKLDDSFGVKA